MKSSQLGSASSEELSAQLSKIFSSLARLAQLIISTAQLSSVIVSKLATLISAIY
jgi:hypothetical protein